MLTDKSLQAKESSSFSERSSCLLKLYKLHVKNPSTYQLPCHQQPQLVALCVVPGGSINMLERWGARPTAQLLHGDCVNRPSRGFFSITLPLLVSPHPLQLPVQPHLFCM